MKLYERILFVFFSHWISTIGVVVTTASALLFVGFQFTEFTNPYDSLIVYIAVPAVFLMGLILIPAGLVIRTRRGGGIRAVLDSPEWNNRRLVRLGFIVLVATGANLALMSTASYRTVEYMDSDAFCGTMCHVMEPQFAAYQRSPHSEIGCVECHIGPGASSFLTAKLEGVGRLAALVAGHEQPIRIGEDNRGRVALTCGNCHGNAARSGEVRLRMIRAFGDDEQNTPQTTLLTMYVDSAIHPAHAGGRVEYIAADTSRQVIPWTAAGGQVYASGETPSGDPAAMTCIDCHNRVGHPFETVTEAVDNAISEGRLARSLPFVRRDAVAALETGSAFPGAANAVAEMLERNVFPGQDVDWNTYTSQIGHAGGEGCFRCHDGQHVGDSGAALSQNCFGCHALVAIGEPNPAILDQLGVE